MRMILFHDILFQGEHLAVLENISKNHIYLFSFGNSQMKFIAIYTENNDVDFTTDDGFSWLRDNLFDDSVKLYNSNKNYSQDKLSDKFDLIKKCI